MTRESESELLHFCATQRGEFHEDAWTSFPHIEKQEMAAVCLFLAGVDWFGHEHGLRAAAHRLLNGVETPSPPWPSHSASIHPGSPIA